MTHQDSLQTTIKDMVQAGRGGGRHGLGDLGAVDLQPAQCSLLPADPLASLVPAGAGCLAGRAHPGTRVA